MFFFEKKNQKTFSFGPHTWDFTTRRLLLLIFALALMAIGGFIFSLCLKHPTVIGMLRFGFGAAFFIGLGGFLIWDDFIAPRSGKS